MIFKYLNSLIALHLIKLSLIVLNRKGIAQLNALREETKGAKSAAGEIITLDYHQSLGLLRFR